jgi:hypothetical protein
MELSLMAALRCVPDQPEDKAVDFLDLVYDEMRALGAHRVWMNLDEETHDLTLGWTIGGKEDTEAVWAGLSLLRTALHAAGGATPEWPTRFTVDEVKQVRSVRPTEAKSRIPEHA